MQRGSVVAQRPGRGLGATVGLAAFVLGGVALLSVETGYDTWGAFVVAPILVALSLPVLSREARREGDQMLFWVLVLALLLKLAGAVVRHFVAFDIYGGAADAAGYDAWGERISASFRSGVFETGLPSLTDTNFLRFLTGVVYTVTGPTQLGGFMVFSWLGFWGLFLFYRGFRLAVPEGDARRYAYLLFFLPSLWFWPSSIGKEAWMTFTLGLAAFGAARVLSGRTGRGLVAVLAGLWFAGMVRPHIAALMGLALVAGALLRRPREDLGHLGMPAKAVALAAVAMVAVFVLGRAEEFLREAEAGAEGTGVDAALTFTADRTGTGGSEFQPSVLDSPARAPSAIVTVLFRPFPFEAANRQMLAAALEGALLLLLALVRWRWLLAAARSMRRQPYVAFALAYLGLSILAFSSIANFGILARQRVQFLPLLLVLLCIPPPRRKEADADARG